MPRHLPTCPYCTTCRLRIAACVCSLAPWLETDTRVIVIVHALDWGKTSNSGHLARLALANCDVRRHGLPFQSVDDRDIDAVSPSTIILYPGRGAPALCQEEIASLPRPLTLLVPDGNWNQVRHMMRRVPMLARGRAMSLETPRTELHRPRDNQDVIRRSTFEAIAQSLGIVENAEIEERLLAFYRLVLKRKTGR